MNRIREIWKKVIFETRMFVMDARWRMSGQHCHEMHPPSFYHRHTPEEVELIALRERADLLEMIEGLANKKSEKSIL